MTLNSNSLLRTAKSLTVLAAIAYILIWIGLAIVRAFYPFELEWMEGEMVDHVARVLAGKPLYVEPSIDFVPAIYTPLYTYVSAAMAKLIGLGFTPLRMVSLLSTLGCFILIFGFVKRETNDKVMGLLAAGLFAATYRAGGAFFDVARVDMLFLLLILASVFMIKFRESIWGWSAAGLLLSLAYLTKQSALLVAAPLLLYCLLENWRRAIYPIAVFILFVASFSVFQNSISNGWYMYYTWELPKGHELVKDYPIFFVGKDLMGVMPVAVSLGLLLLTFTYIEKKNKGLKFYLFISAGLMLAALAPRMKVGGYDNCLIPAYALLSILFGLGLNSALHRIHPSNERQPLSLYIWLLCLLQFGMLFYRPDLQLPTVADRVAGKQLISRIRSIEGNVFIPFHGYYSVMAGKSGFAHAMAIADVYRGKNEDAKLALSESFGQAARSRKLKALILDTPTPYVRGWGEDIIIDKFGEGVPLMRDDNFWPVTGMRTRPESLHIRSVRSQAESSRQEIEPERTPES